MKKRMEILLGLLLLLLSAAAPSVLADPTDLSGGVMICHAHPTYELTNFCTLYDAGYGIDTCADQVTSLAISAPPQLYVCYVVAAWTEDKEWSGVEFGLGEFDAQFLQTVESGPCDPLSVTVHGTAGWPGPNEGVTLIATDDPWSGNYRPVYWFAQYVYTYDGQADRMELTAHPQSGLAGFFNYQDPPNYYEASCLGALGINESGTRCCPNEAQDLDQAAMQSAAPQLSIRLASPVSSNGTATVYYHVPVAALVTIRVFDAAGRHIDTLLEAQRSAGDYATRWNGRDQAGIPVGSGVYHLQVETESSTSSTKLLVAR